MMIIDSGRLNRLRANMDEMALSYQHDNTQIAQSEGCGNLQGKMGDGPRVCESHIIATNNATTELDAPVFFNNIKIATENNKNFVEYGEFNEIHDIPQNIGGEFGGGGYRHKMSGRDCSVMYKYSEAKAEARIICDTTPWFTRNISKGRLFGL